MKIKNFFLTFILINQAVSAQEHSDMCKVNITQPKKRIKLSSAPNFFISADPSGKYTGVIDGAEKNILVNMETGKHKKVPGPYDPVFTPDSKFLTLPNGEFYELSKISEKVDNGESARGLSPDFEGKERGVYQSVGILPGQTEKKKTYRYMHDGQGATFFDVEMEFDDSGALTSSKKLGPSTRMCGKEASYRDTPMLSKDGKYLSILNFETYTTQIWKVGDDGKCKMMVDIGVPTGKVDFGFDENNPQITFHVDEASSDWHYFNGVHDKQSKNVYVMNLDKNGTGEDEQWAVRDMAKISAPNTEGLGSGSYYPRFRKDGSIVAVTQDGQNQNYYLDVFQSQDLDYGPFYPEDNSGKIFAETSCSNELKVQYQSMLALGWLWTKTCDNLEDLRRNSDFTLIPMGLDRDACLELVEKKWDSEKSKFSSSNRALERTTYEYDKLQTYVDPRQASEEDVMSLSKEDLQAVCPDTVSREIQDIEVIGHTGENTVLTDEQVVDRTCAGCHESSNVTATTSGYEISDSNAPFVDFKISSPEDAMVWRKRIFSPSSVKEAMPPITEDLNNDGVINKLDIQANIDKHFTPEQQKSLKEKLLQVENGEATWDNN